MEQTDSTAAKNYKWTGLIGALLLAIAISLFLHIQFWRTADLDDLYHFRHAWIYQTRGFFDSSFPWVQYSVIKDSGADLWYGFHFLLIPFTYIKDPLLALKVASFAVTTAGVLLIFFSLKRLGIKWPHLWTVLFLTSAPDLFYRFSALRPQIISFGLSFLFFAYFFRPADERRKNSAAFFLISFVSAWIHGALFWVNFVIFAVGSLVEKISGRKIKFRDFLFVAGGTLLGLLLRPQLLRVFKLIYVQLVRGFVEKYKETPLLWGTELLHFAGRNFMDQFLPITAFLLFALFLLYRYRLSLRKFGGQDKDFKVTFWAVIILSASFFWLAFASARRSADYFWGFAIITVGLIFTHLFEQKWKDVRGMVNSFGIPIFTFVLMVPVFMTGFSVYRYEHSLTKSYRPERARGAAEWLLANSESGDIVFHTQWDQFAELFFWNQKNYYINGMDPIFMYAFNPALYWKQHYFALDQASSITCGAIRCTKEMAEDSYQVLKEEFRARYIYLQKQKNPNFLQYLSQDPRFEKTFENAGDIVFRTIQ